MKFNQILDKYREISFSQKDKGERKRVNPRIYQ